MSGITYDYMEQYIKSLINEDSEILKELESFANENSVPIVQKETGKFLEFMVAVKKPLKILELGTAIGYSAILMCMNSGKNTKITTIERDDKMVKIASDNIFKYGYKDKIEVLQGDCLEVLKSLDDEFDMIFMDAGKGHYNHFLPECLRLLNKDGIIVADNVLFRGMVANNELVQRRKITIVKRMRKYLDLVSNDDKLITSIIPMGDGIAVTTRRNIDNE
ncbi:Predicted O-methyltransferase YrrM [Clostridium acidisoli DSM 12555]|jgi:predicted O-methyltransferase YrrM|uniref:tRNA 5-hydroxyuridine methyltransferase n=1 Tax=Clostridium acidisoli DSM 12555 TaxID=1121291 RepID=A0A1W1XDD6_9CLOT|nr:O-methyltransferase [Clostridium acidisoli]SMC21511.1 Predicted O-methyltransferase YrrM [Clostridium acidisoli DSM 12555]